VVGVDNFSKYGPVKRSFDSDPHYRLVEGDAKDVRLLTELAADCDQVVAGAAMIGGISYFHEFAYDLLAENERICAGTFDAALSAFRRGHLRKITVVSSSMVFESTTAFPTPEGAQLTSPPPRYLWLSEARHRILRPRCARAVRLAVHDRAALQLRRHRGEARAARPRRDERERQARDESRRS